MIFFKNTYQYKSTIILTFFVISIKIAIEGRLRFWSFWQIYVGVIHKFRLGEGVFPTIRGRKHAKIRPWDPSSNDQCIRADIFCRKWPTDGHHRKVFLKINVKITGFLIFLQVKSLEQRGNFEFFSNKYKKKMTMRAHFFPKRANKIDNPFYGILRKTWFFWHAHLQKSFSFLIYTSTAWPIWMRKSKFVRKCHFGGIILRYTADFCTISKAHLQNY